LQNEQRGAVFSAKPRSEDADTGNEADYRERWILYLLQLLIPRAVTAVRTRRWNFSNSERSMVLRFGRLAAAPRRAMDAREFCSHQ